LFRHIFKILRFKAYIKLLNFIAETKLRKMHVVLKTQIPARSPFKIELYQYHILFNLF